MGSESLTNNRRVLQLLARDYALALALEFALRLDGDEETADRLAEQLRRLEKRMRKLRGALMNSSHVASFAVRKQLQEMTRRLESCAEDVEDDVNPVEQVAAASEVLDQILEITRRAQTDADGAV